jgi:hypothetical protein
MAVDPVYVGAWTKWSTFSTPFRYLADLSLVYLRITRITGFPSFVLLMISGKGHVLGSTLTIPTSYGTI